MLTNRERVIQLLLTTSQDLAPNTLGVSAQFISKKLAIQRSTVSLYLNELVRNGEALKTSTRPVYFIAQSVYEANPQRFIHLNEHLEQQKTAQTAKVDPFKQLIGAEASLKNVVNQIKSAVIYPPNGMSCLLVGDSGVGKSYLAQLAYEFAKREGFVTGKFTVLNCAEYADNPELLSSILFGHVKGAFTGAEATREGLLATAKDGYLFLDEVHRLAPESQEKLFQYMDKGTYRPVGETKAVYESNARLIFATTEKQNIDFLQTFLRRIPMVIQIPSFHHRTKQEKLDLIANLFLNEAHVMHRNIKISAAVAALLVNAELPGNVGKLQSIVKLTCAESLLKQRDTTTSLLIKVADLPLDFMTNKSQPSVTGNPILINYHDSEIKEVAIKERTKLFEFATEIIEITQQVGSDDVSRQQYFEVTARIANKIADFVSFDLRRHRDGSILEFLETTIKGILGNFYLDFGINRFNSNSHLLALIVLFLNDFEDDRQVADLTTTLVQLQQQFGRRYNLSTQLVQAIAVQLNLQNPELYTLFIFNFIFAQQEQLIPIKTNAVIVTHGYSTASSIATTVNRLLNGSVYEGVDMPLDASISEVVSELKRYFRTINTESDLLLLVDMGSLTQLAAMLEPHYDGKIAMMTNVSTAMALVIGQDILKNQLTTDRLKKIAVQQQPQTKVVIPVQKAKVILTTCITGIGAAKYLQRIVTDSTNGSIKIVTKDFYQLKQNGLQDPIFDQYNVKLIIGTDDPNIKEIPYLSVEELINPEVGNRIFLNAFPDMFSQQQLTKMNQAMVRAFTLDNIAANLAVLDPQITVGQVEQTVLILERSLGRKMDVYLRISLYMHLCFMVERIVQREPNLDYHQVQQFQKTHQHFIQITTDALSDIQHYYKITIPVSEIGFIYDILNSRLDLANLD